MRRSSNNCGRDHCTQTGPESLIMIHVREETESRNYNSTPTNPKNTCQKSGAASNTCRNNIPSHKRSFYGFLWFFLRGNQILFCRNRGRNQEHENSQGFLERDLRHPGRCVRPHAGSRHPTRSNGSSHLIIDLARVTERPRHSRRCDGKQRRCVRLVLRESHQALRGHHGDHQKASSHSRQRTARPRGSANRKGFRPSRHGRHRLVRCGLVRARGSTTRIPPFPRHADFSATHPVERCRSLCDATCIKRHV
mmetsp:Transcript_28996/g.78471  ORF Transcript_28996/g.78471 Transcript_28996/m.78471 type:complete len:251 (-) Transcript_28996:221-973(-)